MDERTRQRQFEEQFLSQLRNRAGFMVKTMLRDGQAVLETVDDGVQQLEGAMRRHELFDRRLIDEMPGARAAQIRFQKNRVGGLFKQTIGRLRAMVLAPPELLLKNERPAAVGRDQVLAALARYQLLPTASRPTSVLLASATGFSEAARALVHSTNEPRLILMSGRDDGGWDVEMPEATRRSPWARLFEFETQDELFKRLMHHLEQSAHQLDSSGIALPALAQKLGLPLDKTDALVRRACRSQPRLMTVLHDGTVHLCRTPVLDEESPMKLWSRIRRWLRMKPTVAEQVREMTIARVRLEQQRAELDQKLATLQTEERQAREQGTSATSDNERKHVAARIVRVGREQKRLAAQANVITQQIDVLGTRLHNLTLMQQGRSVALPSPQELAKEAAEAEQVVAQLSTSADLAASVEVGAMSSALAAEEAAVFDELKALSESRAGVRADSQAAATAGERAESKPESAASAAPNSTSSLRDPSRVPTAPPPVPATPARNKPESARPEVS